ncbi:hypothetical protein EV421DRAFT_1739817 [Armillaria borealis]|uniref:Fe2OG dioxygenase domain-containing protein n=1 Tax=Armillaria borealis TaxID=47425 RepID=A0AA39J5S0_9AGAR|nr:hypothetical protein EV421DRAFT_1739817 [Armillaria borealis]
MSTSQEPEHPIVTYLGLKEHLYELTIQHKGLHVKRDTPVTQALDNVISYPFVSFNLPPYLSEYSFMGPNETSFGTLDSPNIDAIRSQSLPSSFGRGDQTVTDPTYRNGREVRGENLKWPDSPRDAAACRRLALELTNVLEATLFVGKQVEILLYKLALYDKGGHFDWHRDSTHGDNHHATILVALNTSWEGGSLLLRHNGQEMTVDMHPKVTSITHPETPESESQLSESEPDTQTSLRAAAFYTDVEHKVEPVTEGVRLILQYDVFVSHEEGDPHEFDDYSNLDKVSGKSRLHHSSENVYDHELQAPCGSSNEDSVSSLVDAIREIIASGTEEVGFPLRHLYRQASIRKEYLKGADAIIYAKLTQVFDVSLVPMILEEISIDGDWTGEEMAVYKALEHRAVGGHTRKKARSSTEFHLNLVSDVMEISSEEYIEHTGNEAQEAECRYFGGGMFLREKRSEAQVV